MSNELYAGREADDVRGQAIIRLTRKALLLIKEKYGYNSPNPRPYHGVEHSLWVMNAAYMLGEQAVQNGNIPAWQLDLLLLSGAYHNVFHERGAADNELKSAELAAKEMESAGVFYGTEIAVVQDGIMATLVREAIGSRIVQSAEGRSYFAKLMADADLSWLGAALSVYWDNAQRFFAENNPGVELKGQAFQDFARNQVRLVGGHRYYTEEAHQTFHHQPEIIDFLTGELASR